MAETIILWDGTKVNVPEGLTDGEVTNYIARTMPNKAIERGIAEDIEREYDIRSGVGDFGTRFANSLTRGNPEEIKAEFNNIFGVGNWGLAEFSGQPFVTPEGLRAVGIEPKDNRKVMLDGTDTTLYDLVDIIPEAVVGATALAAEALGPQIAIPGTGAAGGALAKGLLSFITSRGLVARSGRLGFGDVAANLGLETAQLVRGTQRESLGEIIQDAGTEGLAVFMGSLVLGAPFSAAGGVANRIRQSAVQMSPGKQSVQSVSLKNMAEAQQRVGKRINDQDAMLLSLRTWVGERGTLLGNLAAKVEGVGTKQLGDTFTKSTKDFLEKYQNIYLNSIRLGDDEFTTLSKLKSQLSKSEQKFGADIIRQAAKFEASPLGKIDIAARTVRGFKDAAQVKLLAQYRRTMEAFGGEKYYGQFKNLNSFDKDGTVKTLSTQRLANFLNRVSADSKISVDKVVNSFGPESPLHGRITSRVRITDDGNVVPIRLSKAQQKLKNQGKKYKSPYRDQDITPQDLFDADKQIRKQAYSKRANLDTVRTNLSISAAAQNQISRLPEVGSGFKRKLQTVNKKYSKFADTYRGKNGLFEQLTKKTTDDSQQFLNQFVNGAEGREFATLLDKIDDAFGKGTGKGVVGGSVDDIPDRFLGQTREELLGTLGINFIRENKTDVLKAFEISAADGATAAKRALSRINALETTISKKLGDAKARRAFKEIFGLESIKEYKSLLRQMHTGAPELPARKMALAMSFKEAQDFVAATGQLGANLGKGNNLDLAVQQLRRLEVLDKKAADFYRDLMWSENWGSLVSAQAKGGAPQVNMAIKQWSDNWINARNSTNGVENMTELFGKEVYEGMDDLALNIRGALNIDPMAGALSVAQQPISFFQGLMNLNLKAAAKPLAFIFGMRQFGPGKPGWLSVNKMISQGMSPEEIVKANSKQFIGAANKIQKLSRDALSGRNGLLAASVSAYLEDANDMYPLEEDVPTVVPQKIDPTVQEQEVVPQKMVPQTVIPQDTGLTAIQQIAKMIRPVAGSGVSALSEGAELARGAER
jgi:hypothetical protein